MFEDFSALSSLFLRRCDFLPKVGASYRVGKRFETHSVTDFFTALEKRKVWGECVIYTLAVEHPPVESAFTGHGHFASRCGKRKDSLLSKRLLSLPASLANSPLTGGVNAHRCYLKLETFFEHMLRRLLAEVAHNPGATQDNQMISLPVAANIDFSYSSSRAHSAITLLDKSRCSQGRNAK